MSFLKISKDDVKDYLDWLKILLSICSLAIGSLLFKYGDQGQVSFFMKSGVVSFFVAMIVSLVTYTGLVEHKNVASNELSLRVTIMLGVSWVAFLMAFGFLIWDFII